MTRYKSRTPLHNSLNRTLDFIDAGNDGWRARCVQHSPCIMKGVAEKIENKVQKIATAQTMYQYVG